MIQSLFGSFTFLKDPIKTISKNMERFSGTYSAVLFRKGKFILTQDADFINYILRENQTNYAKSPLNTEMAARVFGKGLLFANGDAWLKQRRLIQPGFHQNKINGLYDTIVRTIDEFLSTFPTGEKIDV